MAARLLQGVEPAGGGRGVGVGGVPDYSALLALKEDHANRPLWVVPDGRVYLETYSPIYKQVCVGGGGGGLHGWCPRPPQRLQRRRQHRPCTPLATPQTQSMHPAPRVD